MSTHSPGPWRYFPSYNAIDVDRTGEIVTSFSASLPPTVADGRLMAASPDLLKACESLLRLVYEIPCQNTCDAIRQAEAAIQKARGE